MNLTLPLPANLGNARLHWAQKHRAKNAYWKRCDERQLVGLVPPPPPGPLNQARLTITLYTHNPMDPSNAVARVKWVEDWLVTRGYITDDSARHIQLEVGQKIDRRDPRCEITLEAA